MNVSRETLDRLRAYEALVLKWSQKINLVSRGTLADTWERHIVDSLQVIELAPKSGKWVDLGSGGGFPGIVAAICAMEADRDHDVTLVESDARKSAFLRTALREIGIEGTVITDRIESVPGQGADILTARALTSLDGLLGFAKQHMAERGIALFPKGATWQKEVEAAKEHWDFEAKMHPSTTHPDAVVLEISEVKHV